MCCFSGFVDDVHNTKIFARLNGKEQLLVYSMTFSSAEDVAMVLPLPVVPDSPESAVRFINLEGYTDFFSDMATLFPAEDAAAADAYSFLSLDEAPVLEVCQVGAFEASFVPTVADFSRLDERFRMAPDLFCQADTELVTWVSSNRPAQSAVDLERAQHIVTAHTSCFRGTSARSSSSRRPAMSTSARVKPAPAPSA